MNSYRQGIALRLLLPALALLSAACGQNPVDPEGFTGSVRGCGNFFVYKFNANQTDAVVVDAAASNLALDRTLQEFSLPNPALDVRIERFSAPAYMRYCLGNDVMDGNLKLPRTWKAESGTVRIAVVDTLDVQPWFTTYKVRVSLHNVILRDPVGEPVFLKELDYGDVTVGWLPE